MEITLKDFDESKNPDKRKIVASNLVYDGEDGVYTLDIFDNGRYILTFPDERTLHIESPALQEREYRQ